jgi:hypothetical protein
LGYNIFRILAPQLASLASLWLPFENNKNVVETEELLDIDMRQRGKCHAVDVILNMVFVVSW